MYRLLITDYWLLVYRASLLPGKFLGLKNKISYQDRKNFGLEIS